MSNYYSETSNNLINNTIFKIHNQEFRWKELMRLNPEYIRKNMDLNSLEPFIENLLYSNLKNEENQNLLYCSINLLLQITTEYLSYSQIRRRK